MTRLRRALYEAWREAEGRHDLLVAHFFYSDPRSFSAREAPTEKDFREIARLREAANAAHDEWLRDLVERDPELE
jgi:hypothetical protein